VQCKKLLQSAIPIVYNKRMNFRTMPRCWVWENRL